MSTIHPNTKLNRYKNDTIRYKSRPWLGTGALKQSTPSTRQQPKKG